jgi:hypothetical protein
VAEDLQSIVGRLRAARSAGTGVQSKVVPVAQPDTSLEYKGAQTQSLLRSLGYDDATIQSVAPGASPDYGLGAPILDTTGAEVEATKLAQERGLDQTDRDRAASFLRSIGGKGVHGLAELRGAWDDLAKAAGEKASEKLAQGSTNLRLGMAMLDIVSHIDNKVKLSITPEEKRHELELKYLPRVRLEDPKIQRDFSTTAEAALWIQGQRIWGAANDLASKPPALAAKLLGQLGADEAAAVMADLAARDKAVAKEKSDLAYGQVPQLIAGMAPMMSYQEALESRFDPAKIDDMYRFFDDKGAYGDIAMGGIAAGGALLDVLASPTVLIGSVPTKVLGPLRSLSRAVAPVKTAEIATEQAAKLAQRTARFEDVQSSLAAATKYTEKVQEAIDTEIKTKGIASPEKYRRLILAKEAELRTKLFHDQFSDPGQYEQIMLRTARRNPEYIPEDTRGVYEFRQDAVAIQEPKSSYEILADKHLARRRALGDGPDYPVDWYAAKDGLSGSLKTQRILLGPSDAEYSGDAINLLVKGAEIDDVMHMTMAPEYYVLPDVSTSLINMRKVEEANAAASAAAAKSAKAAVKKAEKGVMKSAEAAVKEVGPQTPETIKDAKLAALTQHRKIVSAYDMLDQQATDLHKVLAVAKQSNDKATVEITRGQLRRIKDARTRLAAMKDEPDDLSWLPKNGPGIMESPERLNRWLEVAGDRVIRSLHPGGLNLHFWTTKLGQGISVTREPQRYYSAYDPAAWERIRSSYMRYDQNLRSANNLIAREMEAAGVLKKRGKFDARKSFSPYAIDQAENTKLFDLLDQVTGTQQFDEMYAASSPQLQRAHDRIRSVFDHYADLQGISGTDRYLRGYMRHVFDITQLSGGARPLEYIGLPAKAEVFASHLMERSGGAEYAHDAVLALDLYTRAANRKIILEPLFDDILTTGQEIATKLGNPVHQTYANDLVAQLKGKPTFLGAKVDEWIGGAWNAGGGVKVPFTDKKVVYRPGTIDRTLMGLTSMVHTGLLTASPTYPVIQIASGLTTTVGRYGIFRTSKGLWMMATKEGRQLSKASDTYRPFVDIFESPEMRKYTEFFAKIPANQWAERVSRGVTFNAAVDLHMSKAGFKTWKQAVQAGQGKRILFEALRSSEEVNHMYGPLGRSPWVTRFMGTAGSGAVSQFLSFLPKQSEELLAQAHRNPGRILQHLAVSGEVSRQAANAGIDMTRYIGAGYLPESVMDVTSPAVDAALTNLDLMQALTDQNPDEVQKFAQQFVRQLHVLIPTSQAFFSMSKAVERGMTGEVSSPGGKLYNMQMQRPEGEGLGGELLPTLLMQPNIRETLTRRALRANTQENLRFGHNAQVALDHFLDALEAGDDDAANKLADELSNVYNVRFSGDRIQRAIEARSTSQVWRSMQGNPQLQDVYWENFRKHGVPVTP